MVFALLLIDPFDVDGTVRVVVACAAFFSYRVIWAAFSDAGRLPAFGRAVVGHAVADQVGRAVGVRRALLRRFLADGWFFGLLVPAGVAGWMHSGGFPADYGPRDWLVAGAVYFDLVFVCFCAARWRYGRWSWPHDAWAGSAIIEAEPPSVFVETGPGPPVKPLPDGIAEVPPLSDSCLAAWSEALAGDPAGPFAALDEPIDWTIELPARRQV